jgi:hypothetical protein
MNEKSGNRPKEELSLPVPPPGPPPPPQLLTKEQGDKIIERLNAKEAKGPCPRCANTQFTLMPGTTLVTLQAPGAGGLVIGGPAIPCVITVCARCGFLSTHALGTLGFLSEKGEVTGL